MSIQNRINDAIFLWENNHFEGAFLSVLVAVAATSRREYPKSEYTDRQAFENFLNQGVFKRISVEYRGECYPTFQIFYKWFRCELVHDRGLPIDIEFMPDTTPGTVSIRAGGAPDYVLKVSYGWFHSLIHAVVTAPINKEIFKNFNYKL